MLLAARGKVAALQCSRSCQARSSPLLEVAADPLPRLSPDQEKCSPRQCRQFLLIQCSLLSLSTHKKEKDFLEHYQRLRSPDSMDGPWPFECRGPLVPPPSCRAGWFVSPAGLRRFLRE